MTMAMEDYRLASLQQPENNNNSNNNDNINLQRAIFNLKKSNILKEIKNENENEVDLYCVNLNESHSFDV